MVRLASTYMLPTWYFTAVKILCINKLCEFIICLLCVFVVFEVTRKIRHLRTYYAKLLREGSKNTSKRGRKIWHFFDQMDFLHDHIVQRALKPVCNVRIYFMFHLLYCYTYL